MRYWKTGILAWAAAFLLIAPLYASDQASDSGKRIKPPYKVYYNNDMTNIVNCTSPWNKRGEPFTEEKLKASIDEVAPGVDAYLLSPGLGWAPWWQSKVYPDHY